MSKPEVSYHFNGSTGILAGRDASVPSLFTAKGLEQNVVPFVGFSMVYLCCVLAAGCLRKVK